MVSGQLCPAKFSRLQLPRDTAAGEWTPRDPVGDYWVDAQHFKYDRYQQVPTTKAVTATSWQRSFRLEWRY
jgi:hypothetical protein